jgi:triacylglycerol lipase
VSSTNNIIRDASGNVVLDPSLAYFSGAASAAAYMDNTGNPGTAYTPPSLTFKNTVFKFIQRFTGFDDVSYGSGEEERFAVLYQSTNQYATYLIAFRGTASHDDMILDLESGRAIPFKPYTRPNNFPVDVNVGDGFYKIYSTKNSQMTASLQEQIFSTLKTLTTPIQHIVITGHSLGGALANLFALDVAVSLPQIAITSITYASPRTGTSNWQTTYDKTYSLFNRTIRIRNSFDLIPKLPPENWPFEFKDVGQIFPVSFGLKHFQLDVSNSILSWHSLTNYQYVVNRECVNHPQIWQGEFDNQAHPGWKMLSYDPYAMNSPIETLNLRSDIEKLFEKQDQINKASV